MAHRLNKIIPSNYNRLLKICGTKNLSAVVSNYQAIPSAKSLPIVGSALGILAVGGAPYLHVYADKKHKQLGPIFKDKLGPMSTVFVSNPDYMREVFAQEGKYPVHIIPEAWMIYNKLNDCSRGLLFMDGEEWLHFRRITNKHLLKGSLTWIDEASRSTSKELTERLKNIASTCEVVPNIELELYRWSLNTTVAVLLGKRGYENCRNKFDADLEELASIVHLIFEASTKFQVFPASLAYKWNTPSWKKYVKTTTRTLTLANRLVLKLLNDVPDSDGLLTKLKTDGLVDSDLSRIAVDLVLAAGDTTVYTMLWTLYSISKDDTLQTDLRKSSPTFLRNVMKESLRLYPVAPFLSRILTKETTVAGYNIPSGTIVLFSAYTNGRDGRFFENPDEFRPDRWLRDGSSEQKLFMPFGLGARSCVGKKIAESQLLSLISDISKNFNLKLMNENEVKLILKMVAVPSEQIKLKVNLV